MGTDRLFVGWISRTKGGNGLSFESCDSHGEGEKGEVREGRAEAGLVKRAEAHRDQEVDHNLAVMATPVASRQFILAAAEDIHRINILWGGPPKSKTTRYIHRRYEEEGRDGMDGDNKPGVRGNRPR